MTDAEAKMVEKDLKRVFEDFHFTEEQLFEIIELLAKKRPNRRLIMEKLLKGKGRSET